MRFAIMGAVGYALMAVIAFGHSASHYKAQCKPDAILCDDQGTQVSGALLAGICWPLYFSWEMQK